MTIVAANDPSTVRAAVYSNVDGASTATVSEECPGRQRWRRHRGLLTDHRRSLTSACRQLDRHSYSNGEYIQSQRRAKSRQGTKHQLLDLDELQAGHQVCC
jgi:hypothetical protein